jgi:choloylglycine hydrolase
MLSFFKTAVLLLVLVAGTGVQTYACTTFCLKNKGEVLFGKNYDWMIGDGMIFVNKRGVSKEGTDRTNGAKWVSKYGSVTFNQYGRENPSGGMNEAGLAIELMWLDDTQYPKAEGRPVVDVLEWIQYNLDNYATVDEVIRNGENTRIVSDVKLHYMVNDREGNAATIEFLEGKFIARTGSALPVPTLTNDTYARSLDFAKKTSAAKAQGPGSLERFTRAAERTREFYKRAVSEKEAVDYAFEILANVAQQGYTQWSIVYDQKRGRIYFRTMQSAQIKSIDARSFDYSCGSTVKMLDINAKESGDVTGIFKDYTHAANRDLIERSFRGTPFLKSVPSTTLNLLASYPEKFPCAPDPQKKTAASYDSGFLGDMAVSLYLLYLKIASA